MGPFVHILTRSKLIAAYGDDDTAVVMYDADTVPVKDAPGAECLTIKDGKISHIGSSSTACPSTPRAAPRHQASRTAAGLRRPSVRQGLVMALNPALSGKRCSPECRTPWTAGGPAT